MTVDLEKHAKAILNASGRVNGAYYLDPKLSPDTRTAILAACRALAEDAAKAGYAKGFVDGYRQSTFREMTPEFDPASVMGEK